MPFTVQCIECKHYKSKTDYCAIKGNLDYDGFPYDEVLIINKRANKNMLYGALWCVGGIIATAADFGYIFWGAIMFGAIQFFRGLPNRN